jgi:GDP-mannose 6-dehydrogenase
MVSLIETLIGKGYQLSIYDPDVSLARLVGANKEYIEREIPHISKLMSVTIDDVIESSEVIIIGNNGEEFRQIEARIKPGMVIIDLARVLNKTSDASYQGICW